VASLLIFCYGALLHAKSYLTIAEYWAEPEPSVLCGLLGETCADLAPAGNKELWGWDLIPPTALVGWGGESEGKGKTHVLG